MTLAECFDVPSVAPQRTQLAAPGDELEVAELLQSSAKAASLFVEYPSLSFETGSPCSQLRISPEPPVQVHVVDQDIEGAPAGDVESSAL